MSRTSARLWDIPCAAFLILLLLTASQRLNSTHWARGLGTAVILTLIGVVMGFALGLSIFKPRSVFWLTFGYSLPIVILVLGSILYLGISWPERAVDLSDRLAYSFGLFILKQPVRDTLLFVVFMALVFWIIGLMAGYALTRYGNIIGAIVPAGVAFVVVQLYDMSNKSIEAPLPVFLFLCLLLIGRLTYVQRRRSWKEQRVSLLDESRTDLNITIAVVALAAVLLAWLAPTSIQSFKNAKTAWDDFTEPLRDVEKDLGHAVAGLQASGKAGTAQFFGDALPLGHQAATGDTAYLQIQTPIENSTGRYYWRVRSYNIFLNNQWYAENVPVTPFAPEQAPIALADPEGLTSDFAFTALSANLTVLVTPARPVWVSFPSDLFFVQVPKDKMDPILFQPDPPVLEGERYYVRANVYEPTIVQLRSAGDTYPDWVTGHYLQLPDTLSPKIVALSQRITEDARTPYDMAAAITEYLRSNITYSKTIEDPPAGRDPLDWFLLGSKSGFCNYYATAEVIMLRAVGIPARMVVGFAQGEFEKPDQYVVRERDSHAWPEVYFPDVGWVEFEPTVSQALLVRPLDENPASAGQAGTGTPTGPSATGRNIPEEAEQTGTGSGQETSANRLLRLILIWVTIFILLQMYTFGTFDSFLQAAQQVSRRSLPALLIHFLEKRGLAPPGWLLDWTTQAELDLMGRSYLTVYRSLHWLGRKASPAQTPAEAADGLTRFIPNASREIYSLLREYQHHLYSQKHGSLAVARRAVKIIRQETWRVAIRQRWGAFRGIFKLGHEKKGMK